MSLASDLKTLVHLTLSPIRGASHQERLDSFYGKQAKGYDAFRAHLLPGRRELYQGLPTPRGGLWIEMGGGTAANLEHLGPRLGELAQVWVVDLSASLLEVARARIDQRQWTNVKTCQADVTQFNLSGLQADVITFSYSLTMIPDWFAALENARRLLKPGGCLGVVDFFVSRKYPNPGFSRHGWMTRTFWPAWLGLDNVHPNPDHVPFLHQHFRVRRYQEGRHRMRYFPLARVPYYLFQGCNP